MQKFNEFFRVMLENSNVSLNKDLNIDDIRQIISRINEYFYTNYEGIGYTKALDEDFEYFSEFHKFWERYHKDILKPIIDENQCEKVADILHYIYVKYNKKPFYELYDTHNLSPEEVCKVRYFSANQDFRGSRDISNLFELYIQDPSIFDVKQINENPEGFLKNIKVTSLSQNDKRIKFAQVSSKVLIEEGIEPYDLIKYFNNDISEVRNFLINSKGAGYGNKKTDMFLRDMVVLGIWKNPSNFDKIDVASDINTIKVALRTGILKTEIPLISSFLDIFCHQYGLIDEKTARAWRKVWELWKKKYPSECIESPCLIDYLAYRIIGKDFCKESLTIFKCEEENHEFRWHSSSNKTCQICYKEKGVRNRAYVVKKVIPCMDNEGCLSIEKSKFVTGNDAVLSKIRECPFVSICSPQSLEFRKLNPPKSISILGQTGWESAKVRRGQGGGGLMA